MKGIADAILIALLVPCAVTIVVFAVEVFRHLLSSKRTQQRPAVDILKFFDESVKAGRAVCTSLTYQGSYAVQIDSSFRSSGPRRWLLVSKDAFATLDKIAIYEIALPEHFDGASRRRSGSRPKGKTMPLKKGGKKPETIKKNIATNIQQLVKDGTPHNQAVAIAMDIAEKAKKKSR